jgi:hypothetical protein
MVTPCKLCGLDEEKFGKKHRCIKPPSAKREPYQQKAPQSMGRLARRTPETQPHDQKLALSREPQLSDIMAAIAELKALVLKLRPEV